MNDSILSKRCQSSKEILWKMDSLRSMAKESAKNPDSATRDLLRKFGVTSQGPHTYQLPLEDDGFSYNFESDKILESHQGGPAGHVHAPRQDAQDPFSIGSTNLDYLTGHTSLSSSADTARLAALKQGYLDGDLLSSNKGVRRANLVKPWWEYQNFSGISCNSNVLDIAVSLISRQAIDLGTTTQVGSRDGVSDMTPEQMHRALRALGGKPLETYVEEKKYIDHQKKQPGVENLLPQWETSGIQNYYNERWIWPEAILTFWKDSTEPKWGVRWYSNNMEVSKGLLKISLKLSIPEPQGEAFVLVPSQNGLTTASIGVGGTKLLEDNYRPEVVEAFHRAVTDMGKKDPMGRLFLVDGLPGTGKTYLLRAFLDSLPKLKFIIVSSNMASSMKGPELIALLLSESNSKSDNSQPLVLLIEDADEMLVSRGADNVSAISSILNISDGIVGNLLNIRILATTNAPIHQIDEAIMRPGRLSARIEVGMLDAEHAKRLYGKLGGTQELSWDHRFYSLAEVYAFVKGADLDVEKCGSASCGKKKAAVGFCK